MSTNDDESQAPLTSLERLSRRSFLTRAGMAGVAGATATLAAPLTAAAQVPPAAQEVLPTAIPGTVPIKLNVNGKTHSLQIDPRATVLDTLRETLHLTGTKKGCDHGQCGACTVHVNGQRVNSCLLFATMQQGKEI